MRRIKPYHIGLKHKTCIQNHAVTTKISQSTRENDPVRHCKHCRPCQRKLKCVRSCYHLVASNALQARCENHLLRHCQRCPSCLTKRDRVHAGYHAVTSDVSQ